MSQKILSAALAIAASAVIAMPANAHPRLIGANPAPNSIAAAPREVQLHFSERLVARFTSADILRVGDKGRGPAKLAGTRARLGTDGKTLTVAPSRPLATGGYRLQWRAVSVDTHRVSGSYDFRVR